jgi:hypothetical protein
MLDGKNKFSNFLGIEFASIFSERLNASKAAEKTI